MIVSKIEPPCWHLGQERLFECLQLLLCGTDLDGAVVETTLPHVGPVEVVGQVDAHYLLLYVTVDPTLLSAGTYSFTLRKGTETLSFPYEIRPRNAECSVRQPVTPADVVYLLMPDRFARGGHAPSDRDAPVFQRSNPNGWHGGNLQGITDHLDYLAQLGVTALWLTPVLDNGKGGAERTDDPSASYHGYAITDFYQVDDHFGTRADLCQLVHTAHTQWHLKVVLDMVLNHCGAHHPWLQHPPMRDWFNETDYAKARHTNYRLTTVLDPHRAQADVDDTVRGWFTSQMPDLNMENPHLFQYLTQMTAWWVETTGADAIRMDTYPYVPLAQMKAWQERMHSVYPDLSVIAETWVPETAFTAQVQQRNSDGRHTLTVMDFAFHTHLHEFVLGRKRSDAAFALYNHFVYDFLYRDATQTLAFIDNHDMWRWAYLCHDLRKTKQALGILLTVPRIPQLFYGTEFSLAGTGECADGAFRQDFPGGWPDDPCNKFTPQGRTDAEQEIFHFTQTLLRWRRESVAVARGRMTHYIPQGGIYVYFRHYRRDTVMVVVNAMASPRQQALHRFAADLADRVVAIDIPTHRWFDLSAPTIRLEGYDILILQL